MAQPFRPPPYDHPMFEGQEKVKVETMTKSWKDWFRQMQNVTGTFAPAPAPGSAPVGVPIIIPVGASPFLWQNTTGRDCMTQCSAGVITAPGNYYSPDNVTFYQDVARSIVIPNGHYLRIIWTVLPTLVVVPLQP